VHGGLAPFSQNAPPDLIHRGRTCGDEAHTFKPLGKPVPPSRQDSALEDRDWEQNDGSDNQSVRKMLPSVDVR